MIRFILPLFLLLFVACNGKSTHKNIKPQAKIVPVEPTINALDKLTFDALPSIDSDGKIVSYSWLDENNQSVSNERKFEWTAPTTAGTYHFTLVVTDDKGATDTKSIMITVQNHAPIAKISATTTTIAPAQTLRLDASTSIGNINTYEWIDQNNQRTSGQTFNWTAPSTPGNYTITLTVTDNAGTKSQASITIEVKSVHTGPFAAIKNLIASGNATYICVGDSTRAVDTSSEHNYQGQHVFEKINSSLTTHGVNSFLEARVGHEAKQFNLATTSPTWTEIVSRIDGDGDTTIVDISLGINDLFSEANNGGATVADIKKDLRESILKIQKAKPNTLFMLSMPNSKDPSSDSAIEISNTLKTTYQELSSEMNIPLVDVQSEINFTPNMFQNDNVHFHLTPAAQEQVANLILSKILP